MAVAFEDILSIECCRNAIHKFVHLCNYTFHARGGEWTSLYDLVGDAVYYYH